MTDLSSVVGWGCVAICVVIALVIGYAMRGPKGIGSFVAAFLLSVGVAFGLCLLTALVHTVCIESLRLCMNRGDGNMSTWLLSLIAAPVYFIAMLIFPRSTSKEV